MELAHISDLHLPLERERLPGWGAFLNKRLFGWLNLQVKRRYPPEINHEGWPRLVRKKLAALKINDSDIADAIKWARKKKA